jgi:muscarinic acetylcholine receptor M3
MLFVNVQVLAMVTVTWVVPSVVFFLSIFGWQYFVGQRTVPAGKCYVQYMEEALFNCLLQVSEMSFKSD